MVTMYHSSCQQLERDHASLLAADRENSRVLNSRQAPSLIVPKDRTCASCNVWHLCDSRIVAQVMQVVIVSTCDSDIVWKDSVTTFT